LEQNADHWRSSSKFFIIVNLSRNLFEFYRKVEQKPSQTYYELQKRQLKGVNEIKIINRNPIVEGDFNNQPLVKIRQVHFISFTYFFENLF